MGDRRVVDHTAVDQPLLSDLDGPKHTRNRSRGRHRIHGRTLGQQELASVGEIEGDQVQRDRGIGEVLNLKVSAQQLAETAIETIQLRTKSAMMA